MAAHDARSDIDNKTAREIMRTNVLTVSRSTTLRGVEQLLGEHRIGGAPVTDEAGHIIGIVSMRDLLEHYSEDLESRPSRNDDEEEETVADIMNSDVYSVPAGMTVSSIAAEMIEHQIHRVLVEENGHYVGLITTFDLLAVLSGSS